MDSTDALSRYIYIYIDIYIDSTDALSRYNIDVRTFTATAHARRYAQT